MMDGGNSNWERCISRDGCPYYLNKQTLVSQWEHPYFSIVLQESEDYSDVIYAAYRTALKLLHIRNNLHLQSLDVDKLEVAFSDVLTLQTVRHNEYITLTQLDEIVEKLYLCCDTPLSQTTWCGAMSSCLLYFFDSKKRGTVNTISAIIFLTTLCSDKLSSKYSFIFQCLSEHDLVGPQDISHMKKSIFTMLSRIDEDKAYRNGFEGNGTCMTRDMFLKWLFTEPKFIVWLSTLHRIHSAVTAVHQVKCYICKEQPIIGLRYRCLQCFNVDMCFQCFTRIPSYGKHDKSHAIEEYCLPSKKMQDVKAFIHKIKNNIKKAKHSKNSNYEVDVTAIRQPATIWHESKLRSNPLEDATPPYPKSSMVDRKDRPISESSTIERYNSLSRGYRAYKSRDGTYVYTDRLCPSLPRRSIPQSESQFTDNSLHYEEAKPFSLHNEGNLKPTAHQSTQTAPILSQTVYKTHTGSTHHAPVLGDPSVNQNYRPQHAKPSQAKQNDLDFYTNNSWSSSHYTKEHRLTDHYHRTSATITHRPTSHHTTNRVPRAYNIYQNPQKVDKPVEHYQQLPSAAYSEDEGIALHCESLSSGSHYAEHMDRTLDSCCYKPMYKYNNGISGKECSLDIALDYTKYSWDKFEDMNKYSAYSTHMTSLNTPHSTLTNNTTQHCRVYQALDGIHNTMDPLVKVFQV